MNNLKDVTYRKQFMSSLAQFCNRILLFVLELGGSASIGETVQRILVCCDYNILIGFIFYLAGLLFTK